ncbi:Endoplasmic [Rhizoctonia solani]|uniref:Endoplasmic n=1 Tax=Rhizoctonia solani TaxID=456999 RepID=A0A8H7LIC9_9AGAM|nr:Endoplasmic [Rhizoctonia solani]
MMNNRARATTALLWTSAGLALAGSPFPGTPGSLKGVLGEKSPKKMGTCHKPTGPIETTLCDFETVESVNSKLFGQLADLVTTPFFKYFKVDLYRSCPFWEDDGYCVMRECGVTSVDESQVPEMWRTAALSKVQGLSEESRKSFPGCYYRDSDFCFLDDEATSDGEYVDLTANPERFTGYSGQGAHQVWKAIYEENCFGLTEAKQSGKLGGLGVPTSKPLSGVVIPPGLASEGGDPKTWEASGATCLEKRVYYRIISGLHASISTHICMEILNRQTGEWEADLQCYIDRVASHPERLQNIYFNAVLMLRALRKVGPYLQAYNICSGDLEEEKRSRFLLNNVLEIAGEVGKFDESTLFKGADAAILREEFKDRFRNVTRIMDCIGCTKCRLWGKIQTTGVATALKILFEFDEATLDPRVNPNLLQRAEVVALINTLHRFTESLNAVEQFRKMWELEYGPAVSVPSRSDETVPPTSARPTAEPARPSLISKLADLCPTCVRNWAQGVQEFASGLMTEVEDIFSMSKDGVPRPDL